MGTQPIPESTSEQGPVVEDWPRIGPAMWVLLAGFLVPPALVTWAGNTLGGFEHQTLWVVLLGLPFVVMLISLPRRYCLDARRLTIHGLFYRFRIPRDSIRSVRRVGVGTSLIHPGSVFCSDPGRALRIERQGKFPVLISPRDPTPFLALDPTHPPGEPSAP